MAQSPRLAQSMSTGPGARAGLTDFPAASGGHAGFASLPLSLALRLEECCGRFEAAWQEAGTGGSKPQPEDYLASAPEEGRQALLRELFRIDLAYRREAGELLDPEECKLRFPGLERSWLLSALTAATATLPYQPETGT